MDFIALANKRQSTRKFINKEVEEQKLLNCLEAARLAPSACNSQPWTFIVVNEPDLKSRVARETYSALFPFNKFVQLAPVMVVVVVEKPNFTSQIGGRIKNKDYVMFDIGIAVEHFCLQAAADGLGTCILGWFNESEIKKILQIDKKKNIGLCIAVGYSEVNYPHRKKIRKSLNEMSCFNQYKIKI